MARDLFIGFGTPFWNGSIHHVPTFTGAQVAGEFLHVGVKTIPFVGSMLSVALVFLLNSAVAAESAVAYLYAPIRGLHRFLSHKWYFDVVYNRLVNRPLLEGAYNVTFSLIDKGILEVAGPTGSGWLSFSIGRFLTSVQTGRVYDYAFFMLAIVYLFLAIADLFV